jgi:hypothetical protein
MRRIVLGVGVSLLAAACDGDLNSGAPLPATSQNISIVATVGARTADGDSVTIHIVNGGSDTAYVPRCGGAPLLLTQQFVNGVWAGGVQNFMCVAPTAPGPIQLLPGSSVDIIRVLQAGRYRMTVSVGSSADLSNATIAVSNAVDAP